MVRNGPWYVEMRIGSNEAKRIGGTGRMAELDVPDITFGPFQLTFKKNGAALLDEVPDESLNMCFGDTVAWAIKPISAQELSEIGLPPGTSELQLRFFAKERFSIPGDLPFQWKTYIPEGIRITATTYVQYEEGGGMRRMGAFGLTVLEDEFFQRVYRVVGTISRFSTRVLGDEVEDMADDPEDPELQEVILGIEKALRDAPGGGSKQAQKKLLRELMIQWHPDKQLENPKPELAAKVFLWLQSARKDVA